MPPAATTEDCMLRYSIVSVYTHVLIHSMCIYTLQTCHIYTYTLCMYACMYLHVYIYIYTYTQKHTIHTHIYIYIYICMCNHIHLYFSHTATSCVPASARSILAVATAAASDVCPQAERSSLTQLSLSLVSLVLSWTCIDPLYG